MAQIAQTYSWLRAMSGGRLTQEQVTAGDVIIEKAGLETFANSSVINLKPVLLDNGIFQKTDMSLFEGFVMFRDKAYLDTGSVPTIGFGTIKYPNGQPVKMGDTCTRVQAEEWLRNDCKWVDACLDKYVKVKVTQNQFDALASFVYNVGEKSRISKSTNAAFLTKETILLLQISLIVGFLDNGKRINGLVNRRAAEKKLFLS
ncbi:lysozyme (plasmid) [Acinetobacter baumannii]